MIMMRHLTKHIHLHETSMIIQEKIAIYLKTKILFPVFFVYNRQGFNSMHFPETWQKKERRKRILQSA